MKWIPVSERLPNINQVVMCVSMSSINDYAYPYQYSEAVDIGFLSKSNKWYLENWDFSHREPSKEPREYSKEDYELNDITHWMPLPEPPEEIEA